MLYLGDFGDGGGERLGKELVAELRRRVVVVAKGRRLPDPEAGVAQTSGIDPQGLPGLALPDPQ